MTLEDGVRDALGGAVASSYDAVTVDLPREQWVAAVTTARDELGLTFFDVLTAVDERDSGFDVVLRLWSPAAREGLLLRTRCPRDDPRVPSLAGVFGGAAWHERETGELFGIVFDGHPDPGRLLLSDDVEGHPLRKDFVLPERVAKPWPGVKEPGESDAEVAARGPVRRKNLPLGVPAPGGRP
jgi:NADH-quinone oxidoreductase subunit C